MRGDNVQCIQRCPSPFQERFRCAENGIPQDHFRCVMLCYINHTYTPQNTRSAFAVIFGHFISNLVSKWRAYLGATFILLTNFWWSHQPNHHFCVCFKASKCFVNSVAINSSIIATALYRTFWWFETEKMVIWNWWFNQTIMWVKWMPY